MSKKLVSAFFLVLALAPFVALAAPKRQAAETIDLQVISSKQRLHGSSPNVFAYTAIIYGRVDGKNVLFVCDQRGDGCPAMEDGKTYPADKAGDSIYISMTSPDNKRPFSVKYKETGNW